MKIKRIGHTYLVNKAADYNYLVTLADDINKTVVSISDVKDEAIRDFFKKCTNSSGIIEIGKRLQVQDSIVAEASKSKRIQRALQAKAEDISSAVRVALTLDTGVYATQSFVRNILDFNGAEYETNKFGNPVFYNADEAIDKADAVLGLTKKNYKDYAISVSAGVHNLKVNELYGKAAAANLMKLAAKKHKKGFVAIAEPKKVDYEMTEAHNPYEGTKMRADFLFYTESSIKHPYDFVVGELFSLMNSDYEKRMAEKMMMMAEDYQHCFKAVTADKAQDEEKAKELIQGVLENYQPYATASSTARRQYEWVAINDTAAGETNLDALYDLIYMMVDRLGLASIMPKNKMDLFRA